MKVVVFGGSGFMGSYVADILSEKGYDVIIYDIKASKYVKSKQKMILGNILDEEAVKKAVRDVSIIYNFAGVADIDEAVEKPLETIKNNILGNAIILDAIKEQKIKRYVFASTIYVYSDSGSFYRSSKQACELHIEDYSKTYGIPYTILRYGSLYGPRTDEHNPIYRILKQALLENKISYWGSGEETREFIHVEDAARCSVEILDQNFINQNVILTGQHPFKTKDLLLMINEIFGNKLKIELDLKNVSAHYKITPYSFNPKIGRKYVSSYYLDMGQGLLQCIEELYKKYGKEETGQRNEHED